jgi:hypothetical protein
VALVSEYGNVPTIACRLQPHVNPGRRTDRGCVTAIEDLHPFTTLSLFRSLNAATKDSIELVWSRYRLLLSDEITPVKLCCSVAKTMPLRPYALIGELVAPSTSAMTRENQSPANLEIRDGLSKNFEGDWSMTSTWAVLKLTQSPQLETNVGNHFCQIIEKK